MSRVNDPLRKLCLRLAKWPCARVLQRWRPVAVDVSGSHKFVEKSRRLEGRQNAAAERLAARGVPSAEIDHLETVVLLAVRNDRETVVAPNLFLCRLVRILHLRLQFRLVTPVELASEGSIGYLARNALPREPDLYFLSQIPTGFLEAPDDRARIESRRLPSIPRPLRNLRPKRAVAASTPVRDRPRRASAWECQESPPRPAGTRRRECLPCAEILPRRAFERPVWSPSPRRATRVGR